ncbi:ion transporter [Neptunomonas antarctica]|uniref:Voltage-gated sodium channel n=1 Tax=Neptunomonas antarctica TaxID=619304 RepID=A0A1N7MWC6_9GAMM|nr:ion transporter [Neptunomonas antarctica]SIS90423.1 voltage-gated sodium channel [Neptunomonas antarctica]
MHAKLKLLIENPVTQRIIISLIVINAVLLGLETSGAIMAAAGTYIVLLDKAILGVFVVEIVSRIYIYRLNFWKDPWSLFDFAVVSIAIVPSSGAFSVLRALRVLRVLRLLTMVPSMRRVVGALLSAVPGLISIAMVLLIIYYVFAVISTNLFAEQYPQWFGSLGLSLYTLFQIMTLESWSMGIARPVMETFPYAWAFFIPFILVATFTMLNLFIAIIVNAMQSFNEEERKETIDAVNVLDNDLQGELKLLRQEIRELRQFLTNKAL